MVFLFALAALLYFESPLTLYCPQAYKKKDPETSEEFEMMENLFDALCSCLQLDANRQRFLDAEGTDLMIIMLRNKHMSRFGALKALSHALAGPQKVFACALFVERLGLKVWTCSTEEGKQKRNKRRKEGWEKKTKKYPKRMKEEVKDKEERTKRE